MPHAELPTGTITFLFTDIEGSTKLWEDHADEMRTAVARHDVLVRQSVEGAGGLVYRTNGDSFCVAFTTAPEAVAAMLAAQLALDSELWPELTPIKVRMALHTGVAEFRDADYFGACVNRVARILSAAHGGQAVVSLATSELARDSMPAGASLRGLGEHRLKDLGRVESIFQLIHPALRDEFPALKSLNNNPTNLPLQLTSFIGRENEVAEVSSLLAKARLLTLTGSGGTGKTRLSLQVAADVLDDFPDGVWFVELAPLLDPGLVPQKVAEVLSVQEAPREPILDTLLQSLKSKQSLLVLDNCEHLLGASAQLVDALLRGCPKVRVLASSRETLGIAGETTFHVPSLSVPNPNEVQSPESLGTYESVRLFVERASSVKPDFAVTALNAPALAQVCHRLDGIPLAIELAAARVRSMPVDQIESRLDERFRLLTGGPRTALPRQQTLRALIDWSYDLLNEQEKRLLNRLSVFHRGWQLGAAENVCSGDGIDEIEVLDFLTTLTDKSLVAYEEREGTARYNLLETVRQYAVDRLMESGESEVVRTRHRDFFLALAEEAEPMLTGPDQSEWYRRLDAETENLRAALDWSRATQATESLRLCGSLCRYWNTRALFSEGRVWCAQALGQISATERTTERAKVLQAAGDLAWRQCDYSGALACFEEGLAIRREVGDQRGVGASLNSLGLVTMERGDHAAARANYEEGLVIFREIGYVHGTAVLLNNLGIVASDQGDYSAASGYYEQSLVIYKELGDLRSVADALDNLGTAAIVQAEYAVARLYHEQALAIFRQLGDRRGLAQAMGNLGAAAIGQADYGTAQQYLLESLAICQELGNGRGAAHRLENLGSLRVRENQPGAAATLFSAATKLRLEIGSPLPPSAREEFDQGVAEARQTLGEDKFSEAWQRGQVMSLDEAIHLAVTNPNE